MNAQHHFLLLNLPLGREVLCAPHLSEVGGMPYVGARGVTRPTNKMTMSKYRLLGFLLALLVVGYAPATIASPPYDAIYCFGFSWTDTQGLRSDGSPDFATNSHQ